MGDSPRYWSDEATEKDRHDLGSGLFASGSAEEIAKAAITSAREDGPPETAERRAMAKLTFYENRAGKNLSDERRAVIEEAKQLVRDELA
ncbi:MAG TPA: DUF3175 domain-containing protein [Candidatus Cybelea sp.]|jgi:hypothetical protein|nr:DUF3175 domain-containing protein [Candidatus Cybelea sp.]